MHLRGGGTSLVLRVEAGAPLEVRWWGADLGDDLGEELDDGLTVAVPARPASSPDVAVPVEVLACRAHGAVGQPGLLGHRAAAVPGTHTSSPRLLVTGWLHYASTATVGLADADAGLAVELTFDLGDHGVLTVTAAVTNAGDDPYALVSLTPTLPVPARAVELLDLTGRWPRERQPQRHPVVDGRVARESRHGRPGHDAPLLLCAGTAGFANRHGEVWALHVAWSGDSTYALERHPGGPATLGGGELLTPGEVLLEPGETHRTPPLHFAHSASAGLDGISGAFHRMLRSRPGHPRTPRPVVCNTWEAVYFDHRPDRLAALAEAAARVGVERFVVDDGWFRGRRDDRAGLGDWEVDRAVWPDGLEPLAEQVRALGMQFGLWVEPEMVSPDSDLARAHPDWLLGAGRAPATWRHQQVLDLTVDGAAAHVAGRLEALVEQLGVEFLKWDHNRDLTEVTGHDGRPSVRRQVLAAYALLDGLRARFPHLEIESCASGGARVDLGILARTDRVWASDTNDPLERQVIDRHTQLLVPPELCGSHVGPARAHTTGRHARLSFALGTALFGHLGFERDLTADDERTLAAVADAVATYRRLRPLLHTGEVVNGDLPGHDSLLRGVVGADRRWAVFAYAQLTGSPTAVPAPVPLPGLDRARRYRVARLDVAGGPAWQGAEAPPWWVAGSAEVAGTVLDAVGLALPPLLPAQVALVELVAV